MSKIFSFIGAQGVGKTTILNEIIKEHKDMNVITNVVRDLCEDKRIKINKKGNSEAQQIIFDVLKTKYIDYLFNLSYEEVDEGCISDRSLIDVVAYTKYLYDHKKINKTIYELQLCSLKDWVYFNSFSFVYIYIPIEFPAVDDGVRDVDEKYRREIDENIKWILQECGIDYYILEGSIEERAEMMKNIIEFNKTGDQ